MNAGVMYLQRVEYENGAGILDQVTKVTDLKGGYYKLEVCNVAVFVRGKACLAYDLKEIEILDVIIPRKYRTIFGRKNWTKGYLLIKSFIKPKVRDYITVYR